MTDLNVKTLDELVRDQAAATQGSAKQLADMQVGSILRAVIEAVAGVALWLQGLVLEVLSATRLSTSTGADIDSFLADFGAARLPAVVASGMVTFSRFTTGRQALIPVGAIVQTASAVQRYSVVADTGHAAYSAELGGYVLAANASSISIPVQALISGAAGNAAAGAISMLAGAIPGVDTVTNPTAFDTGADAQSDAEARAMFVDFISSLREATPGAIVYAINALRDGVTARLVENHDYAGNWQPGYFYVVIDDGTGYPTSAFLDAAYYAVDAVRAAGVTFGLFPPVIVTANVSLLFSVRPGYTADEVAAEISKSVSGFILGLGLGEDLLLTRLYQVAYDAHEGVANVTALTINLASSDIVATQKRRIMPGAVTVSQ